MSDECRLIKDDDDHWYVIPVKMESEFAKWLEGNGDDWDCDLFDDYRVDGPHSVIFDGWREK